MSETTKRTQLRRIDPTRALLRELAVQDAVIDRILKRCMALRRRMDDLNSAMDQNARERREAMAVQERVKQALAAYAGAAAADGEGGEE